MRIEILFQGHLKEDATRKIETRWWDNINIYYEELGSERVDFSLVTHT